jgi:hypothetical protein
MVWFCPQKWLQFRYNYKYYPSKYISKVVVIPVGISAKISEDDRLRLLKMASEVTATLAESGVRTENDIRKNVFIFP